MTISVNTICGVMLGFEIVTIDEEEVGTFIAVDLFILRFLIEW